MFLQKTSAHRWNRLYFIGLALLVALFYDFFVWDTNLGFGFLLFVVASIGLFTLTIFRTKQGRRQWAILLTIPIITMAIDIFFFSNNLVTHGVPLFILVLSLLFVTIYSVENPDKQRFLLRTIPLFRSIDLPFLQWGQMYKDLFRWQDDPRKDVVRKVLIGLVIAVPLIIIFTWLFATADEVFKDWLLRVLDIQWVDVWRLFRTLVMTLFLGSLFYVVMKPEHKVTHTDVTVRKLDTMIVSIILLLINVLFGIFVFFQFKYLFGGADFVLGNAITYAEYARKGFFQLCWVIVLAAVMLLIIYRSFVFHKQSWIVTILQTLLIAQIGVIAASALKRMNLYQDAYGFTVLRLYVEWFLYFVLTTLAFAGISLIARIPFRTFFYVTILGGVAALTVVTSINVDLVIAKENIRRFVQNGVSIDMQYLRRLSTDSTFALRLLEDPAVFARLPVDQQRNFHALLMDMEKKVGERSSWKELHIGSIRASQDLITISTSLNSTLRELRLRDKRFLDIASVLRKSPYAECQSFNEQSVRAVSPESVYSCAYQQIGDIQYVYVLQNPQNLFARGADNEYDASKPLSPSLTVIDLSNGVKNNGIKRASFVLPAVVKKYSRGDDSHYSYNEEDFVNPRGESYLKDGTYRGENSYTLLPDGRLIESNWNTGVHRMYTVVRAESAVELSGPIEIDTLAL